MCLTPPTGTYSSLNYKIQSLYYSINYILYFIFLLSKYKPHSLIMHSYLLKGGKTWINKNLLIEVFKIPSKSIMNRVTDSSYYSWNCLKQEDELFVDYDTIPISTKNKYSLPSDSEILEIAKAEEAIVAGMDLNKKRTEYKMFLEHSVRSFAKSVPYFIQLNGRWDFSNPRMCQKILVTSSCNITNKKRRIWCKKTYY